MQSSSESEGEEPVTSPEKKRKRAEESSASESEKEEAKQEGSTRYNRRRPRRSGKCPRNQLADTLKSAAVEKKLTMQLRRESKRHSPDRFNPCTSVTQRISNTSETSKSGNETGKDEVEPGGIEKQSEEEKSDTGKDEVEPGNIEKQSEEQKSDSSAECLYIPDNIGRSRIKSRINFHVEDPNICSVCKKEQDDLGSFTESYEKARICGECCEKVPRPLDLNAIKGYVGCRNANNSNKCLACGMGLDIACHSLGDYRFCAGCVSEDECPCHICRSLKNMSLKKMQEVWNCKLPGCSEHKVIGNDFSTKVQIMLLLRRSQLPPKMMNILVAFTSLSPRKGDGPVICANHRSINISDLRSFGTMKCYNARASDRPTVYQWIHNTGKKRQLSKATMLYAQELLMNQETICIPHCENVRNLEKPLQNCIEFSRELKDGIFSFRFIQVFIDLISLTRGNDWTSFVVDLQNKKLHYFDRKHDVAKKVLFMVNSRLENEWKYMAKEEDKNKKNEDNYEKIVMGTMANFSLDMFGEDSTYRSDTGVAAILHSWTMTSPDMYGSKKEFDPKSIDVLNTFDLFDTRLVERLLANDMNMHLFIDFNDIKGLGWNDTN